MDKWFLYLELLSCFCVCVFYSFDLFFTLLLCLDLSGIGFTKNVEGKTKLSQCKILKVINNVC